MTTKTDTTPDIEIAELETDWIKDHKAQAIQIKVAELTKRCKRIGMPAPIVRVVDRRDLFETIDDEGCISGRYEEDPRTKNAQRHGQWAHRIRQRPYAKLHIYCPQVKLPGNWELVARVQRVKGEKGEANIIHTVPEKTCPDTFRDRHVCDHCGTKRRRKDTFVVVNDKGEHKQVGRQCIRDFLGHVNPSHLEQQVNAWGFIRELLAADDDSLMDDMRNDPQNGYSPSWSFIDAVATATHFVRVDGFAPTRSDASTRGSVTQWLNWSYYGVPTYSREDRKEAEARRQWVKDHQPTDKDIVNATAAIEWAANQTDDACASSDYLKNLRDLCRVKYADWKTLGLLCSLPMAYDKAMARETKRKEQAATFADQKAKSDHVGQVGDRLRDIPVTLKRKRGFEGYYGYTRICTFEDDDGNCLVWFNTGTKYNPEKDERYLLTGTVKKHDDFKGLKQTNLSRCILKPVKAD